MHLFVVPRDSIQREEIGTMMTISEVMERTERMEGWRMALATCRKRLGREPTNQELIEERWRNKR